VCSCTIIKFTELLRKRTAEFENHFNLLKNSAKYTYVHITNRSINTLRTGDANLRF